MYISRTNIEESANNSIAHVQRYSVVMVSEGV